MSVADYIRIAAVGVPLASATTYGLDQAGLRPAVNGEVYKVEERLNQKIETQGLQQERQRLIDRKKDGVISEFERGILFGLCRVLHVPPLQCDKEDG